MNFIWDKITEWLKGLLVGGIVSNLSGLFDSINTRVADVASTVGKTPQAFNGSIFNMIKSLSENVVVPIAGIILTFVMCLELIQLLVDRNNMHDFETFIFFKWIIKTFAAVLIVTNTWNIVMGVFDVAQHVVSQAAGVIIGDTALDVSTLIGNMEARLREMDIGPLFGLWFQSSLMGIIAWILSICIFIIVYGRMIEIYMVTAFLIMVCVGIYAVLVQNISVGSDVSAALWTCIGYTVLLCFTLFKSSSLAKSVFNAH